MHAGQHNFEESQAAYVHNQTDQPDVGQRISVALRVTLTNSVLAVSYLQKARQEQDGVALWQLAMTLPTPSNRMQGPFGSLSRPSPRLATGWRGPLAAYLS